MNSQAFGLFITIFAILWLLRDKMPFIWRLPGNFELHFGNITIVIPLAVCMVIGLIVTIFMALMKK